MKNEEVNLEKKIKQTIKYGVAASGLLGGAGALLAMTMYEMIRGQIAEAPSIYIPFAAMSAFLGSGGLLLLNNTISNVREIRKGNHYYRPYDPRVHFD